MRDQFKGIINLFFERFTQVLCEIAAARARPIEPTVERERCLSRACYALWISWFRTAHDGLILAKHSALKAIPLAIFINIHSVKRYFDLS